MTSINYLEKITELCAFVSVDEGGEGLVAMTMNVGGQETFMPFVCADKARMEDLKHHAKDISKASGKKVKLIRLSVCEELKVYE